VTSEGSGSGLRIPAAAASCAVCSRKGIPVEELRLATTEELYMDSHEGASIARCELCATPYLCAWMEVFDDTWGYYRPVSQEEAEAVAAAFRAGREDREPLVWGLVRQGPVLERSAGAARVWWREKATILGGPSYGG